jgi:hypothetical protein
MAWLDRPRALLGLRARDSIARVPLLVERADPGLVPADYGTTTPAGSAVDWQYMPRPPVVADPDMLIGGRLSRDFPWQIAGNMRLVVPPDDYNQQWLTLNLDDPSIRTMSAPRLIRTLAEASPEVSRALWDFLRVCNPGWTCTAFRAGTLEWVNGKPTGTPYKRGQDAVKALHRQIDSRPHSSLNTVIGKLFFNAYLRGAMFAECILDADARTPLDIVVPDAATARFMRSVDPVYGDIWTLGQFQIATFVPLTRPTIMYLPIDPAPGIPYGRSPAAPAIFASLFLLGLLHDVRRVVAQQGYPRLDISIDLEKLRQSMPAQIVADPKKWLAWVQQTTDTVKEAFYRLKPDQAFVHSHVVTVNRPVGALDTGSLGAVPGLIEALERMLARALKTMPLLMGNNGMQGEANSNRQWEIEIAGIRAVQDLGQSILNSLYEVALEAQGVAADVAWDFDELRDAAAFRNSQTQQVNDTNAAFERDQGWISQDEAANKTVGHDSVDDPPEVPQATPAQMGTNTPPGGEKPQPEQPRPQAGGPDNADTGDSKDPGANRAATNGHARHAEPAVVEVRRL